MPYSASGEKIFFVSERDALGKSKEIFFVTVPPGTPPSSISLRTAVPVTSADPERLSTDEAPTLSPTNPDELVFQSDRYAPGQTAIYRLDLASGIIRPITAPGPGESDTDPAWAHDGARIAFTRTAGGVSNIYVLDTTAPIVAGKNPLPITDDPERSSRHPAWDRSDSTLAFSSNRTAGGGDYDIYCASPTGTNQDVKRLTENGYDELWPKWSPLGPSLVFQGKPGFSWIVYSLPSPGSSSEPVPHTYGARDDERPCFSPDGKSILYQSRNGDNASAICLKPFTGPRSSSSYSGITVSSWSPGSYEQPFWGNH